MTDTELKLMLLRYNLLSKERAEAAYRWGLAGESAHCRDEWLKYADEMTEMMKDFRKHGYEFTYTGSKTVGEVQYAVYRIVAITTAS